MKVNLKSFTLRTISLVILVLVWFSLAVPAQAQVIVVDGEIPAGQQVDRDVLLVNDQVVIDGVVDGDVFAVGASVTVNGEISGSLFALAQQVSVDGQVGGSIYAASVSFELGPDATIGHGLYYTGASLITAKESQIERDVYGVFLGGQLGGKVGRDVQAIIGPVEIFRVIADALNLDFSSWRLPQPGGSESTTPDEGSWQVIPLTQNVVMGAGLQPVTQAAVTTDDVITWVVEWLKRLLVLLLVGLIMLWLLPGWLELWSDKLGKAPLASTGYGLAGTITGFVALVLLLALLLAIVIGLGSLGFWNLAFLLGLLGMTSIGVGFTLFLLLLLYASKVIVSYLFGRWLVRLLIPGMLKQRVLTFLLGLLIYMVITAIPYLGWVIAVAASIMGLGVVWVAWADPGKQDKDEDVVVLAELDTSEEPQVFVETEEPQAVAVFTVDNETPPEEIVADPVPTQKRSGRTKKSNVEPSVPEADSSADDHPDTSEQEN